MKHDPNANLAGAFVPRHDALRPLAERAANLLELRRLYRDNLPPGLAETSQVANFREGVVIVVADNSAAAAKLKQLTARLTAVFQQKGWQVNAIKVQVQARK